MIDHKKRCIELLRANSHRHRLHQVFCDFCELAALAISNSVDRAQYDQREARYMTIIGKYQADEVKRFPEMIACCVNALHLNMHDFLGSLFMSLELGGHNGQFFTPYEISKMMALMTFHDMTPELIAEKGGFITASEPAVGAGAMCIALAETMVERNINYQQCLHITATDVDATAVHMAYLQLSLLHVPAIVVHGNSLSLEVWGHWLTPAHILGGWDFRLRHRGAADRAAADRIKLPPATKHEEAAPDVIEHLASVRDSIVTAREQLVLF